MSHQRIAPPPDEWRPFEATARYIDLIADGYQQHKLTFDHVAVWLIHYQNDQPDQSLRWNAINERDAEIVNAAYSFVFQLVSDIGKEKFGEVHDPITPERLAAAKDHAQKLRGIVQGFGIKY